MNDIEAIKVLEDILAVAKDDMCVPRRDSRVAAISHSIAALKAKSDAEVVLSYAASVERGVNPPLAGQKGYGWEVNGIDAPTLSDLAKKIGEVK